MKTLIILGGLPGVGKSYCSKILKNKISNCLYFDSDLFAKKYVEKHKVDFVSLPKEQQTKQRLKHHKAKIEERNNNQSRIILGAHGQTSC